MAIAYKSSVSSMATKLVAKIRKPPSSPSPSPSDPRSNSVEKDLKKLERTLRRIQLVLNDAEEREIRDESVKLWLKELKAVAYDAEDVLDEYQYELRRLQILAGGSVAAVTSRKGKRNKEQKQVRGLNYFTLTNHSHVDSMADKIREIRERFDEIAKDREALRLTEEDGNKRPDVTMNLSPTSSHMDESGVFGRDHDKEKVIDLIFSDVNCKFSVIPIVGMGGLGKTTLTQLVYNDHRVCQYFNSVGWVCVSDNFDVPRLTCEIIESITRKPCGLTQLNALQDTLKEELKGKRVLLVLDDVWNEQQRPWDSLRAPFAGAETVRIIITTRNDSVAKIMQTVPPYRLGFLPENQCWLLFQRHAFGVRDPEERPHLVDIGRKIVKRCGGLPLAVKTLGGLLHYESREDRWMEILESDLWDLDEAKRDILPALKLSYHRLPAHLKPCFLFSSVFPKDYKFGRDRLVKLWMAHGYILYRENKSLEDIGSQYFDELQARSFFQSVGTCTSDRKEKFVLHDTIHDLARYTTKNEYCEIVLKDDYHVFNISREVRHLYVNSLVYIQKPMELLSFDEPRALRTLIVESTLIVEENTKMLTIDDHQLVNFSCLRALELRGIQLPNSVCNLKHLRYLCGRRSSSEWLLQSLCHLYNLQTMDLTCFLGTNYSSFRRLHNGIRNLVNLRHLLLSACYVPIP